MRTDTLERIRIVPNHYGVSMMRAFERNVVFAAPLADVLQRECETGTRALYVGILGSNGELLARARLITDALTALFVDEIETAPGHDGLLAELLAYAAAEAEARHRPLAVMVAEDDLPEWSGLGFSETGYRVLAR